MAKMVHVLFVCLGNICRSPLAEGIFKKAVAERGLEDRIRCDSAGTAAYHIGEPPDPRSDEVAGKHGIVLQHKGRKFSPADFSAFDYIIPMDAANYADVGQTPGFEVYDRERLVLMRDFDSQGTGQDVPDPYYGGPDGFENVYRMLERSCNRLLDHIIQENGF